MTDERAPDLPARWTKTLREGLRTVIFMNPRWGGRPVHPAVLVGLMLAVLAAETGTARWAIDGPAEPAWWAWGTGWLGTVLLIAACGVAARRRPPAVGPGTVFAWTLLPTLVLSTPAMLAYTALARIDSPYVSQAYWGAWAFGVVWPLLAIAVLLLRTAPRVWPRVGVVLLMLGLLVAEQWLPRRPVWYARPVDTDLGPPGPRLTQEAFEAQSRAVVAALDGIAPQRPGTTELYAITFAPYADEDVFSREVAMVGDVLRARMDTDGRLVNLQNHADTLADVPWATPLNLERTIHRMAARMDPDEDILFLHLTSHGARDGQLAAGFEPLAVDPVTPTDLRRWLDEAGVRFAVVSISACFSGSWIPALEAPGTLVMTAADATHTSYGCGRRSELTFFGRAVYDEQLRTHTRSFEAALAAAKPVIAQREVDAGKSDGPSNPQIRVGEAIRPRLAALLQRLRD